MSEKSAKADMRIAEVNSASGSYVLAPTARKLMDAGSPRRKRRFRGRTRNAYKPRVLRPVSVDATVSEPNIRQKRDATDNRRRRRLLEGSPLLKQSLGAKSVVRITAPWVRIPPSPPKD